jgi:16S rRNA (guanine966-N2)-methyltransferase
MPHNKTMRITGGQLVRRRFLLPAMVDEGSVRPTPDRVREAIFSMLAPYINDAKILDLFAGSGAHGFEALSRGASFVNFIEKNPQVALTIKENLVALKLSEQANVQIGDALNLKALHEGDLFDVIFIDPPYTVKLTRDFFVNLAHFLSNDGFIIFRCFKKESPDVLGIFHIIRDRVYGGTRVFVMQANKTL